MKVAIFGATGGIGKHVVEHSLNQGYEVVAYVRTPSKLDMYKDKIKIVVGELNEYEKIKSAIEGCDAVISAVGVSMKFSYKGMPSDEAHKNIVKAMEELNVKRLISWSTPTTRSSEDSKSFVTVVPFVMASIFLPKSKKEIISIANTITNSSLDWTIVRFMAPKDTPFTGKVKVSFGKEKINFSISRSDIACFMVREVTDKTYIKRMPIIGS